MLVCGHAYANPAIFPDERSIQRIHQLPFPTIQQLHATQQEIKPTNERDLQQKSLTPQAIGELQATARIPNLDITALPLEQVRSAIDINKWLDQYQKTVSVDAKKNAALLFLSASIPEKTVKELLAQAQEYGVSVVFRGAMGDKPLSLNSFRQYILAFKLEHYPEIQINPVAFKQFAITEVPALVVAQPVGDSLITETGCAPQSLFAVVYGDIPVDYALEKIQENAEPTLSGIANQYLKKGG